MQPNPRGVHAVSTGRFVACAQVWWDRSRPSNLPALGKVDGWTDPCRQRRRRGSLFAFEIERATATTTQQSYLQVQVPVRPEIRGLVAEDNPVNFKLICRILERQGSSVVAVCDGVDAVHVPGQTGPGCGAARDSFASGPEGGRDAAHRTHRTRWRTAKLTPCVSLGLLSPARRNECRIVRPTIACELDVADRT
jgi:hypothetical protein